jgi:maltose alpha-D-glucosyltransferase/alpha-amylase
LTTGHLDRFLEERRLLPAGDAPSDGVHNTYLVRMTEIGVRLAELHRALAEDHGDEAFRPERMTQEDVQGERSKILDRATALLDALTKAGGGIPAKAQPLVAAILGRRDAILKRLDGLVPAHPLPLKIRYHGDFHLGQVMIVQGDVYILDFEGEPHRRIEERRRKGVMLRDVAGQLRSLDYAGLSALERLLQTLPDGSESINAEIADWRNRSAAAFLDAYRAGMAGHPAWPEDELADDWIRLLQVDKVIYEVGYELSNRPSWLHMPLIGLWTLLFNSEAAPV